MQDWDRIAMLVVGLGASVPPALEGWRLWKESRYTAVVGLALLILGALAMPVLLILFAT